MRALILAALLALIAAPASAEPHGRTIWRRLEVAPGVSQDYEVRFQYRVPMVHSDSP